MKHRFAVIALILLQAGPLLAQGASPAIESPDSTPKPSWFGRMFHRSPRLPQYKDPKLRGLDLQLQLSPQPLKLSETRQMQVRVTLTNRGKNPIALDFPTDQRIEIYLRNAAEAILTKWSDNHVATEKPETILINPQEHVEYVQTIATRELTPDKVFIVEVFFPNYPELRIRQKILTQT
jgi:Intracellular proteinase inhibitor